MPLMICSANRVFQRFLACSAVCLLVVAPEITVGATFKTANFVVHAPTDDVARQVGEAAEYYRKELALEWTGHEMPNWYRPCPIKVKVGNIGAGGATTFSFDRGQVFGWKMEVQGTLERILDSVIPHEVNHTVFACHFRRPLPRWADEGAATLTEHESEKARQTRLLNQVIRTSRRIPLTQLLDMTEYPKDMKDVLTLYAEGYALADLLVQRKGKATYLKFLEDGHQRGWNFALKKHYSYNSVDDLERRWSDWVIAGSPSVTPDDQLIAANTSALTTRGQTPAPASPAKANEVIEFGDLAMGDGPEMQTASVDNVSAARLDRSQLTRPLLVESLNRSELSSRHDGRGRSSSDSREQFDEQPRSRRDIEPNDFEIASSQTLADGRQRPAAVGNPAVTSLAAADSVAPSRRSIPGVQIQPFTAFKLFVRKSLDD